MSEPGSTQEEVEDTPPGDSVDLLKLLSIVWLGRKTVAVVAAGFAIIALVILLLRPNVYTSTASFLPPSNGSSSTALLSQLSAASGGLLSGGIAKSQGDLYVGILKSATVQDALITRFHLQKVYQSSRWSDLRKQLAASSKFESDSKTTIITLSVTDPDPARARDLASGYLDALQQMNQHLALVESSQRRLFFSEQLAHEKDALADAEVELKKNEETSGLIAPAGQTAEQIQTTAQLRAQITAREVQLSALRQVDADENIDVVRLHSEIGALQQHLAELQRGDNKSAGLSTAKVPEAQLEYIRREREVKYHEALFEILARQYEAARLDESHEAPIIQVIDPPIYPDSKSGPHRMALTLVAFVLGILCGSAYIWCKAVWPDFRRRLQVALHDHLSPP